MLSNEEEKDMAVDAGKRIDELKAKMRRLSLDTPILGGEGKAIELDPNNSFHVEWFEDDGEKEK